MEYKDYYKTLGVEKTATPDEIKKSYRKLVKKYHPDTNKDKDAESKFKDISEAYNVLGDPEKKQKYDNLGSSYNRFRTTGGNPTDFKWNEWFNQNTYNTEQTRKTGNTVGDFFNQGGGVSDFFDRIFGSTSTKGTGFNSQKKTSSRSKSTTSTSTGKKRKNYQTELTLTLSDAYKGTTRILNVNGQRIEVKFKAGIADGHIQKISGRGYPATNNNGKPGDLIINVKVKDDIKVERKGDDLYVSADCNLYTAILGGIVFTNTFFGSFNIKVPPETPNGKIFKLTGQGMPKYNSTSTNKAKGDLFVKVVVQLPTKLSSKEKELFEELQKLRVN